MCLKLDVIPGSAKTYYTCRILIFYDTYERKRQRATIKIEQTHRFHDRGRRSIAVCAEYQDVFVELTGMLIIHFDYLCK